MADQRDADDAQDDFPVDGQADGDAGQRVAVDEVHGAVNRVDDPSWVVGKLRNLQEPYSQNYIFFVSYESA